MNMFTKNQYSKYSLMNSTEVIEKMPDLLALSRAKNYSQNDFCKKEKKKDFLFNKYCVYFLQTKQHSIGYGSDVIINYAYHEPNLIESSQCDAIYRLSFFTIIYSIRFSISIM